MKNITLKIDDDTYRKARLRAAEKGTSVSAMVRNILESLEEGQAEQERAEQTRVKRLLALYAEADARAQNEPHQEPWVFNREECYEERLR
jgi:plasmid stability protein